MVYKWVTTIIIVLKFHIFDNFLKLSVIYQFLIHAYCVSPIHEKLSFYFFFYALHLTTHQYNIKQQLIENDSTWNGVKDDKYNYDSSVLNF